MSGSSFGGADRHGDLADLTLDHHTQYAMVLTGTFVSRPGFGRPGRLYFATDTGRMYFDTGATWITQTQTIRIPHTFTISGAVAVASGDTNYIPPFFISLPSGQTATAVTLRCRINSGTGVTCNIQKRSSTGTVTALSNGFGATTTDTTFDFLDVALNDNDRIELVVVSVSGSPQNMTVTVFVEYTF